MKKRLIITIIVFILTLFLLSFVLPQFLFIDDSCYEGVSKIGLCTNYERVNTFARSMALIISIIISLITFRLIKH